MTKIGDNMVNSFIKEEAIEEDKFEDTNNEGH